MVTDHLDSFVLIALAEEEVFQHELVIGVECLPGGQEPVQVLLGLLAAGGEQINLVEGGSYAAFTSVGVS